jgi:NADH:ubiquinone oxidoreductase subunit 5 (subunit L)/multisubunit Na+/H+ antiporter MnhA subunit
VLLLLPPALLVSGVSGPKCILLAIFIPVLGSLLLPFVGCVSNRLRNFVALTLVLTPLGIALWLLPAALAGKIATVFVPLPLGLNFALAGDPLALFMAATSTLIGSIIVFYSWDYISHYENQNEYYFVVVFFLGSMMGIVFSASLVYLFVFWEMTALASWRLIGFFRTGQAVQKADKAFLVTVFGALMMLVGFLLIYQQSGSFDLVAIRHGLGGRPLPNLAVLFILFGIFAKSATLPLHTWLPDAGVAPSPVTALLHAAVLVMIGVYAYARLFVATFTLSEEWHIVIPAIAGASTLLAGGAALIDTDLKRIIAFSTISQIAFIFMGLSVGGEMAVAGALLYILMHGLAKGGLFLCAGIVEQNTHTRDIRQLGGLLHTMPMTAIAFLFCAFSVMGLPPFGGFFGKFMVISGALATGQLWIPLIFVAGAALTMLYLLRIFAMVFLGEAKVPEKEGSPAMVFSVCALAALSLAGGLFISYVADPVRMTTQWMMGGAQ